MSGRESMKERAKRLREQQASSGKITPDLATMGVNTNPGISNKKVNRAQVIRLLAPVSKSLVEFRLAYVEPEGCMAHPANRRNQKMLRPFNPKVAEIKERILEVGGVIEPVKAVPSLTGDTRYQILDGSTRRYALELANQEMEERALKAIAADGVEIDDLEPEDLKEKLNEYYEANAYDPKLPMLLASNCSPEDAAAFARTANEARSNESPWELAQAIERHKAHHPNQEFTQDELAKALGVTRAKVARALTYSNIPESIVALFDAPDTLSESVAKHLIKLVTKTAALKNGFEDIVINVPANEPYTSATQFKRDVDAYVSSLDRGGRPSNRVKYDGFSSAGSCSVKITQNRKEQNKFKVDIVVDDHAKLAKLEAFLKEWSA